MVYGSVQKFTRILINILFIIIIIIIFKRRNTREGWNPFKLGTGTIKMRGGEGQCEYRPLSAGYAWRKQAHLEVIASG